MLDDIVNEGLKIVLILGVLPLAPVLVVGLLASLFQAATQIQEQTLAFLLRIVTLVIVVLVGAEVGWQMICEYTHEIYISLPKVGDI